MKRLILGLILLGLLFSTVLAEENCYWKADRDLQRVYEHFEGVSLEKAIDQLMAEKYGSFKGNNNVQIRFNGGGMRDHLFIGCKNTMEILVKNDFVLSATTLCFEFSCTGGSGSFEWATHDSVGQGPITYTPNNSPVPNCLEIHPDAFNAGGNYWATNSTAYDYPNKIKISGLARPGFSNYLPVHTSEIRLYSMKIWVPDDMSLVGDTFYVDNILLPPDSVWMFADSAALNQVAPYFQNIPNGGITNPNAPPAAFTVKKPRCEHVRKSSNSNIVYFKTGEVIAAEIPFKIDNFKGVYFFTNDTVSLGVIIYFDGNTEDLEALGVKIGSLRYGKGISASFALDLLPKICQISGVKRIAPSQVFELNLN